MTISNLLLQRNMSMYRLSKRSSVPYTTLNDICNGRTSLIKCSAETVYRLARELGVTMEALLEPYLEPRCSFELFKSNVCHRLKELGDVDFIVETLTSDDIRTYYARAWYPESLYLLAMLDYISRINGIEWCSDYDDIRMHRLPTIIYPSSVLALASVGSDMAILEQAYNQSIPEFTRFNIVESEVRNVI